MPLALPSGRCRRRQARSASAAPTGKFEKGEKLLPRPTKRRPQAQMLTADPHQHGLRMPAKLTVNATF
jgi:hypothetical protein